MTRRLGNGLSRLGQYVLRRIKLLSLSGTKKRRDNASKGKVLRSLKRVTRVFSVHSNQFPKSRDSAVLDDPREEA